MCKTGLISIDKVLFKSKTYWSSIMNQTAIQQALLFVSKTRLLKYDSNLLRAESSLTTNKLS